MITAKQYIDPSAAEYHYWSKRVKVVDELQGCYDATINRHLTTFEGFLVEVIPIDAPESRIRVSADNVFLE